jgi:hypothetical protein
MKKAFDTVDHNSMPRVLEAYGFGPKFMSWVKLLNFKKTVYGSNGRVIALYLADPGSNPYEITL